MERKDTAALVGRKNIYFLGEEDHNFIATAKALRKGTGMNITLLATSPEQLAHLASAPKNAALAIPVHTKADIEKAVEYRKQDKALPVLLILETNENRLLLEPAQESGITYVQRRQLDNEGAIGKALVPHIVRAISEQGSTLNYYKRSTPALRNPLIPDGSQYGLDSL